MDAKALARCPGRLLHQAGSDRRRNLARRSSGSIRVVIQRRGQTLSRNLVTSHQERMHNMSQLRIFSYLPNPRIWKATIAARLCGVEVEVRGSSPRELQSWLWDFDARPLLASEQAISTDLKAGSVGFGGTIHKTGAFM